MARIAEQIYFVGNLVIKPSHFDVAGLAQLVRAPGCGSGGRGFDPHSSPQNKVLGICRVFYFVVACKNKLLLTRRYN